MASLSFAKGVDFEANSITLGLATEPPSLDSTMSEDTSSGFLLGMLQTGLFNLDRRGKVVPSIAERWEINGLEATFWLNKNAIWQDGKPVTAHDFSYAWHRLVDPKTGAGGSTFFAYIFKNGKDILAGKKPLSSLGVQVIDDYTITITLSDPIPYLPTVLAGTAFLPLRQDFVEAQKGRYAADSENFLSNGPFVISSWVHSASIKLVKNERYYKADSIHLSALDFDYITPDQRALLNLYQSKDIAHVYLTAETMKAALSNRIKIRKSQTNCVAWLQINLSESRPTANLKLRRAIRMAIDRDAYANSIVALPGTRILNSFYSYSTKGVNSGFYDEYPQPVIKYDIPAAKLLLEEAKKELGVTKIPPLIILTSETRLLQAEFVQAQLANALGIEMRIDVQTFKQFLAKSDKSEYDIMGDGYCGGAMRDPVFFSGIFESTNQWNKFGYNSEAYDALLDVSRSSSNQQVRMDAFGKMQQLIFQDVVIIPTHQFSTVYAQDDRVKGLRINPNADFSRGKLSR